MTKQILFRIWVIGIYLEFGLPARSASAKAGAWDLVLPFSHALSAMRSASFPV
jgi:hypothetical protein